MLFRQELLEDRFVRVLDADNALARREITPARYRECRHAAFGWRPLYMDDLATKGIALDVAVKMPASDDLIDIVGDAELVLTVLSGPARGVGGKLVVCGSPLAGDVAIFRFWTTRTPWSPTHRWVRTVVFETVRQVRRISRIAEPERPWPP